MAPDQLVRHQLAHIERVLKACRHWQDTPPPAAALDSGQPFCVDTLSPCQWLQWVFIPRMRALIAARRSLPVCCAIAPYYAMTLAHDDPARLPLLAALEAFDALFRHPAA